MKLSTCITLVFLLLLSSASFAISLEVNNNPVSTTDYAESPVIINDRTYVPLRFVSDALGYHVDWDAEQKQVLICKDGDPLDGTIPDNPEKNLRIVLNGHPLFIPVDYGQPFINQNNRTMVPVRAISEAMNFNVSFSNNTVYINDPIVKEEEYKEPEKKYEHDKETAASDNPTAIDIENLWNLSIAGPPVATREQLIAYTQNRSNSFRTSVPLQYNRPFLEVPEYLIDYFLDIGREYNIRGDVAYMQAIHETNFFQFTGIVQPHQNNFAGIGATGVANTGTEPLRGVCSSQIVFEPGVHGVTFSTPRAGVEAQIQHLYAYTTKEPLPDGKELLNPRYELLKMLNRVGTAKTWVDLGGTWAVPGYPPSFNSFEKAYEAGLTYGQLILKYLENTLKY